MLLILGGRLLFPNRQEEWTLIFQKLRRRRIAGFVTWAWRVIVKSLKLSSLWVVLARMIYLLLIRVVQKPGSTLKGTGEGNVLSFLI